uniref:Transposase n=1 Tax=Macrostomum lignano TaxID=282301 RepID=A0A1I8FHV1_9PLAT
VGCSKEEAIRRQGRWPALCSRIWPTRAGKVLNSSELCRNKDLSSWFFERTKRGVRPASERARWKARRMILEIIRAMARRRLRPVQCPPASRTTYVTVLFFRSASADGAAASWQRLGQVRDAFLRVEA